MFEVVRSVAYESWTVLAEMSPYLLFGFLVAGILSAVLSAETVERHLGGKGILPVLKASLFGVPLPLCSCGVIPVVASLRRHRASRGAATAFLLSTPQTGADSILVTFSLLGLTMAVFRPLAAFATGLIGGWLVATLVREEPAAHGAEAGGTDPCCTEQPEGGVFRRIWNFGFVTLPRDIGRSLVAGLLIAGVLAVAVPDDYFAGFLGRGFAAYLVMMAVGIPLYVCATASVPIAAELIAKGLSPGAALVFLMTGPATNAATIAVVWKTMGRRTALVYLGTVAACALASGLLLDSLFTVGVGEAAHRGHAMLPAAVEWASAAALIGLLGWALLGGRRRKAACTTVGAPAGQTATLLVGGMNCAHCAQTVQQTLAACAGVASARVELDAGRIVVSGQGFEVPALCRAIERAGYSAAVGGDLPKTS